jgi:hypothetical protein
MKWGGGEKWHRRVVISPWWLGYGFHRSFISSMDHPKKELVPGSFHIYLGYRDVIFYTDNSYWGKYFAQEN